ncbi:MAG: UPF0149 family protein [Ottowia sp.]|uniref:UPF0149 family protein n=1 Tax=Ottowia sp. TaxID=1898956 RepID=UPI0039E56B30
MTAEPTPPASDDDLDDAAAATLDTLEEVLEDLGERHEFVPQWEFCEGALTALLCTRRDVGEDEWLPALFRCGADELFASPNERTRFLMGWLERESQLRAALQAPVDSLDDERALSPAVIDWRGLIASLPEAERAEVLREQDGPPPAMAQLWATGFLFAVEYWADDWAPPRDKEIAAAMADALDCIAALTDDDSAAPAMNLHEPDGPPSVSEARFEAFGEALWAVYDLFDIARSLGPRTAPVRNEAKVGRNDPCPCGSGKKYKKCHGE